MPRWFRLILLIVAVALASCAHAPKAKTKADNSAASGFATIDDGVKQTREAHAKVVSERLSPTQAAQVQVAETGLDNIQRGAAVAHAAYDATSKVNGQLQDKQNERIFPYLIGGAAVAAIGIFLMVGGTPVGLAYGAGTIAGGLGFDVMLILVKAITRPVEIAAYCLAGLAFAASCYLVYERLSRKKQLAVEQKATVELTKTVEEMKPNLQPSAVKRLFGDDDKPGSITNIQSDSTEALVKEARTKIAMAEATPVPVVVVPTPAATQ